MLDAFESLGDNCEFGFVQRKFGLEPSGLLRWAIAAPEPLVAGLKNKFDHLYDYDQLSPSADGMVCDRAYNLYFHTKMYSTMVGGQRYFLADDQERRQIHADERSKIDYLRAKLIEKLESGSCIFVYKRNNNVTDIQADAIHDQLLSYNARNVLLVVGTEGQVPGAVWGVKPGLLRATIGRFASYEKADDVSYDLWMQICKNVYDTIVNGRKKMCPMVT